MDQSQRELRRAAARAFMESLDQLGSSLTTENELSVKPTAPVTPAKEAITVDSVEALEAAAADIEQFIQAQETEPGH